MTLHIYTDGSCSPNPGPGGWGWASFKGDEEQNARCGGEIKSTNNIMELEALIRALSFHRAGKKYFFHSDSQYVIKGLIKDVKGEKMKEGVYTGWMNGWIKSGWKKPSKNKKIWKKLDSHIRRHLSNGSQLKFGWVKAHSGHSKNDRADELANLGRENAVHQEESDSSTVEIKDERTPEEIKNAMSIVFGDAYSQKEYTLLVREESIVAEWNALLDILQTKYYEKIEKFLKNEITVKIG